MKKLLSRVSYLFLILGTLLSLFGICFADMVIEEHVYRPSYYVGLVIAVLIIVAISVVAIVIASKKNTKSDNTKGEGEK